MWLRKLKICLVFGESEPHYAYKLYTCKLKDMYVLVRWMIYLLLDIFLCNERYIRTHLFKAQIGLSLRARHNLFALNLLVQSIVFLYSEIS